jgi:hypothetical protein
MKLSKIINTEGLTSATIHVFEPNDVVCDYFIKGKTKPIGKRYKSLNVDVEIPEVSNRSVKHLGIKRYFHLVEDNYYINLYYY